MCYLVEWGNLVWVVRMDSFIYWYEKASVSEKKIKCSKDNTYLPTNFATTRIPIWLRGWKSHRELQHHFQGSGSNQKISRSQRIRIQIHNTDMSPKLLYTIVKIRVSFHCDNSDDVLLRTAKFAKKEPSEKCYTMDIWQFEVKMRPRTSAARRLVIRTRAVRKCRTGICHDENLNWNPSCGKIRQFW
jgi:hypothetical protein